MKDYIVNYKGSFIIKAEDLDGAWKEATEVCNAGEIILDIVEK